MSSPIISARSPSTKSSAWLKLVSADEARLSITNVAFEIGFGDLSYFNRSFRKRFGCSPSQAKAGATQGAAR